MSNSATPGVSLLLLYTVFQTGATFDVNLHFNQPVQVPPLSPSSPVLTSLEISVEL